MNMLVVVCCRVDVLSWTILVLEILSPSLKIYHLPSLQCFVKNRSLIFQTIVVPRWEPAWNENFSTLHLFCRHSETLTNYSLYEQYHGYDIYYTMIEKEKDSKMCNCHMFRSAGLLTSLVRLGLFMW